MNAYFARVGDIKNKLLLPFVTQFSVKDVFQWSHTSLALAVYAAASFFTATETAVQPMQARTLPRDSQVRKRPHAGAGRMRLLHSLHQVRGEPCGGLDQLSCSPGQYCAYRPGRTFGYFRMGFCEPSECSAAYKANNSHFYVYYCYRLQLLTDKL